MEGGTFRPSDSAPESVYWRRRVIVAAAILLAVALIAWACGGSGDGGQRKTGAQRPAAAVPSLQSPPATQTTAASPAAGATGAATAATRPSSRSPSSSAGSSGDSPKPRGNCRPRDVRVALRADAEAYGNADRPKFTLRVTSSRRCTVDLGPKRLRIVITSGSDRIWSSADCARARGDTRRKVSPHRPYRKVVTWKRVRSDPGDCDDDGAPTSALPGWYVAIASLGIIHSNKVVFQLTS